METNTATEAPTQLPFAVDEAVLEQVAEFLQQQSSMEQLAGPPTDTGSTPPSQIDF